ncbi:MAG: anti-sigma factor [Roseiflexaceae bacterium]
MTQCYDDGRLRAALDDELSAAERAALDAHLAGCPACQARTEQLRATARRVYALLPSPAAPPDAQAALARLRATAGTTRTDTPPAPTHQRRTPMTNQKPALRRGLIAAVAVVALLSLLALPPVRTAASGLLQIFRVQKVVFVPISRDRMQQLDQLDFDKSSLFVGEPRVLNAPAEPRAVSTSVEAAALVGFNVAQPSALPAPATTTKVMVQDRQTVEAQVNVQGARELLQLMGITDISLPDALGSAPIHADVAPTVLSSYSGPGYEVKLIQGRSPNVTLPPGVDLAQLGKAALRLLGLTTAQAEAMSSQIDWSSTLLFPIPTDVSQLSQITINGNTGMLVNSGRNESMVYWQQGDRFFVLQTSGRISEDQLLVLAESVR